MKTTNCFRLILLFSSIYGLTISVIIFYYGAAFELNVSNNNIVHISDNDLAKLEIFSLVFGIYLAIQSIL
jgi:hypothetical protein